MFTKLIVSATALLASSAIVNANMAPSYPSPGIVWQSGKQYDILWGDDGTAPNMNQGWTDFKIDFMTGDNLQQKFITNVASNLDATKVTKYTWTAPEVNPNSAIYFFMFTNSKGESAWTTRFGISGADGKLTEPEHATQANGDKIPWGIGALANGSSSNTTTTPSGNTSSVSAAAASSTLVTPSGSGSSAAESTKSTPDASNNKNNDSSNTSNSSSAKPSNNAVALARPLAGMAIAVVAAGLLF
ncbi:unnamed protein product [Cunninghamella blakesleeana]